MSLAAAAAAAVAEATALRTGLAVENDGDNDPGSPGLSDASQGHAAVALPLQPAAPTGWQSRRRSKAVIEEEHRKVSDQQCDKTLLALVRMVRFQQYKKNVER